MSEHTISNDRSTTCPDPSCDSIAALAAEVALGGDIPPEQAPRLLGYLAHCEGCRRRLDDYVRVGQLLALSAPAAEAPPELRERILSAARSAVRQDALALPRPRRAWRAALLPVLGALVLVLALWNIWLLNQRAQEQERLAGNRAAWVAVFGDDDAYEQRLAPTSQAPGASGRLWIAPSAPAMGVYVKQLPPPGPGQAYQLWIHRNGETISGGTFAVDARGRAYFVVRPQGSLAALERVDVTLEPSGGSPAPTGPPYLEFGRGYGH
jgi:anti-sigma-K factor RskA